MASTYKIISSDSHVIEPWFLWRERLPKKFRDRAPRLVQGEDGDKLVCEDVEMPLIGTAAGVFRGHGEVRHTGPWEEDIPPPAYDPDAWLNEIDRDTIKSDERRGGEESGTTRGAPCTTSHKHTKTP